MLCELVKYVSTSPNHPWTAYLKPPLPKLLEVLFLWDPLFDLWWERNSQIEPWPFKKITSLNFERWFLRLSIARKPHMDYMGGGGGGSLSYPHPYWHGYCIGPLMLIWEYKVHSITFHLSEICDPIFFIGAELSFIYSSFIVDMSIQDSKHSVVGG